jgi:VWFA-related protein
MKKMVSMLAGWLAALVCVSAQAPPSAPPQIPTFRTGVDAVQLDVSVLDAQRRPVRGLTAADFTVLEEGKPRQIVSFSAIELPPLPASAVPEGIDTIQPDVVRNDLPDGRIVVILLDPFLERVMVPGRVTIADPPGITALRATAASIVNGLGPGDLAAVGHTMYGVPQNFTTDKARLRRAIDTTAFGTNKRAEGEEWGNCNCGTCRLDAITRVANALRNEPQRRKVIFFIGERVQLAPVRGQCNTYLEPATKQMTLATQLANVTVNTVDPNAMETTNVRAGDDFKPDAPGGVSGAAAAQEVANRAFLIERQQSLQTVADWTGGRAILNTNAPEKSVRPILEESSAYYLIAFQTSGVKPDGKFHPITVKVNRPDVQVRTRKGYYADAIARADRVADNTVSLEAITREILPERGLPMSVTAAPFRGPNGLPIVVVTTGVRTASAPASAKPADAAEPGTSMFEPIEILTSAFREGEKDVEWQRQRLSIALPVGGPGALRYESVSTLNLKPGHYELRVAARHEHADAVGSVHAFIDVPDFEGEPITLSGLVLLDRRAPTASPREALAGVLESAPTTRRDFTAGDDVSAVVRVYQRPQTPPAAVTVQFVLLNAALRELSSAPAVLAAEQFAAHAADAHFTIPFGTLQPGSYVLRAEADGKQTATRRDVRFTVE